MLVVVDAAGVGVKLTTIEERRKGYTPRWKKNVADITAGSKYSWVAI